MDRISLFCMILFVLFFVYGCVSTAVPDKNQPAALEIENSTPFEVRHIYAKPVQGNEWGHDLLEGKSILPFGTALVYLQDGSYELKAEILVNNGIITVDDSLDFKSGKQYVWTISEEAWLSGAGGDYEYMDTYEYM